jgi:hypothetical protein
VEQLVEDALTGLHPQRVRLLDRIKSLAGQEEQHLSAALGANGGEVRGQSYRGRRITDSKEIVAASPQAAKAIAQHVLDDDEDGSCPNCGQTYAWKVKDDKDCTHELVGVTAKLVEEEEALRAEA